jgi:hypothetical protein
VDTAALWAALVAGITGHPERLPTAPAERIHLLAALAAYDLSMRPDGGPLTGGQAWGLHAGAAPRPLFRELRRALAAHAGDPAAVPDLSGAVLTVEADPDNADACWYRLDLAGDGGQLSTCSTGESIDAVAADLMAQQPC